MKTNYRKPLVVFTPKSLLRHPLATSSKAEFIKGNFRALIDDTLITPKEVKTLVFCSGSWAPVYTLAALPKRESACFSIAFELVMAFASKTFYSGKLDFPYSFTVQLML